MVDEQAMRIRRRATAEHLAAGNAVHPAAHKAHLALARLYELELAQLQPVAPEAGPAGATARSPATAARRPARAHAIP